MKRFLISLAAVLCLSLFCSNSVAAPLSHHPPGVEGLKGSVVPPKGVHLKYYTVMYSAGKFKDKNGRTNSDYNIDIFGQAIRVLWNTGVNILGGEYMVSAVQPFLVIDHRMGGVYDDNAARFTDPLVEPFAIGWRSERWEGLVAVGVWLPVGWYDSNNHASPGFGYTTLMITAGLNVWLDAEKTWHISGLSHYEINSKQEDTHITPGQTFMVEWGFGKSITDNIDIGVAGYTAWQLTRDTGKNADDAYTRAYSVGPEIAFRIPSWDNLQVSIRALFEFENRNRPQGTMSTLAFTYSF